MSKHSRTLQHLRELSSLALPSPLLVPAFLEALHALVPSQRNLFDWCDGQGQLSHYYIEGPVDERVARLYFEEFYNRREAEVMQPFAHALRSAAVVHSASEINTKAFFNSALYWEIWRPQDFKYRVEAIVRSPTGQALGSLVLYRGHSDPCFSAAEEARLPQALPYLARLLETPYQASNADVIAWLPSADPTETLLLDASGQVRHASPGAIRLLLMSGPGLAKASFCPQALLLHPVLLLLREQLRANTAETAAACHQQHSADGCYQFRAQRLRALQADEAPWLQVQITRLEPARLAQERRLQSLGLSAGQTSVCRLLLQGCSQAEAAKRLAVAPSTVADHTRKLYKALGVRSLQELSERVRSG